MTLPCCKCREHNWADPRPPVVEIDGKKYCLFHAPVERKGVPIDEFNKNVSARIQATFNLGDGAAACNMNGVIFPNGASFGAQKKLPSITFEHAVFTGKINFKKYIFSGRTSFKSTIFNDTAFFSYAKFKREITFESANFNGAYFFATEFSHEIINFNYAEFTRYTTFQKSIFYYMVTFNSTIFNGDILFTSAQFKDKSYFRGATFNKFADFEKVKFCKEADFQKTNFRDVTYFQKTSFLKGANFILSSFDVAWFQNITARDTMNFRPRPNQKNNIEFEDTNIECCDFLRTDMTNIHFIACTWPLKNGRYYVKEEGDLKNIQRVRDFYQRMKRKYKDEHNEYEVSKWHIAEKEAQLKLLKNEKYSKFLYYTLLLYKTFSGFGDAPLKALCFLIALLISPLLVLVVRELLSHISTSLAPGKVDSIINMWLQFIPLAKNSALKGTSGGLQLLIFAWRTIVAIQAALFVLALRNRFRR